MITRVVINDDVQRREKVGNVMIKFYCVLDMKGFVIGHAEQDTFGADIWFLDHSYDDYADPASATPEGDDEEEEPMQKTSMRL